MADFVPVALIATVDLERPALIRGGDRSHEVTSRS
jgi:hypothetical protein